MNTMETIFSRASVRTYTGEPVTPEELAVILQAAKASPAGMARFDTLHLTVIHNADLLAEIDAAGAALFGDPNMHPLYGAPTLVVVSSQKSAPGMENVAYSNAAIMVHNMALAATHLGVGSCYIWGATMAMNKNDAILAKLNLPEDFIPCCAITLGKTDQVYTLREIPEDKIGQTVID